jgi:hypothetical protein
MKACWYTMVGKILNSYNTLKQLSKHFIVVFAYYKNFCELRWYTVHFCYEKKHCVNFIGPGSMEPELANLSLGFKSNLDCSPPPRLLPPLRL